MIERMMANPTALFIFAIIGVLGTAITIISFILFLFADNEKREITCSKETNTIIRNKKNTYEKLSLLYDGKEIENLYVSQIAIWNSGKKYLENNDFVDNHSLTITSGIEGIILEADITAETDKDNKFQITKISDNEIKITFTYANKKDGIILQIIHSGAAKDLKASCKIKGGAPLRTIGDFQDTKLNGKGSGFISALIKETISIYLSIWGVHINPSDFEKRAIPAKLRKHMHGEQK